MIIIKIDLAKLKRNLLFGLQLLGLFAGAALAVFLLIEFMWACYYAGIPM